jgi:hypothetical protein
MCLNSFIWRFAGIMRWAIYLCEFVFFLSNAVERGGSSEVPLVGPGWNVLFCHFWPQSVGTLCMTSMQVFESWILDARIWIGWTTWKSPDILALFISGLFQGLASLRVRVARATDLAIVNSKGEHGERSVVRLAEWLLSNPCPVLYGNNPCKIRRE